MLPLEDVGIVFRAFLRQVACPLEFIGGKVADKQRVAHTLVVVGVELYHGFKVPCRLGHAPGFDWEISQHVPGPHVKPHLQNVPGIALVFREELGSERTFAGLDGFFEARDHLIEKVPPGYGDRNECIHAGRVLGEGLFR